MTQESAEAEPDNSQPPPESSSYENDERELSFCGRLVAAMAIILFVSAVGVIGFSAPDAEFDVVETHRNSSISPSGVGGNDSLDNPWD